MPRIRTVKPEFFSSDTVAQLSFRARLTFIGLWTYCDDHGRGRDNTKLIKASVWPLDDVSDSDVEDDLKALAELRLITRYSAFDKGYLSVSSWTEHQKVSHPTESKIPSPQDPSTSPPPGAGGFRKDSGEIPEDSGAAQDMSGAAPLGKEQGTGNREQGGTLALTRSASAPDRFEEFWRTYPRRRDKRAAERAWRAALKRKVDPDSIISSARKFAQANIGQDQQFIKYPATWLNAGAYENDLEARSPSGLFLVDNDPAVTGKRRTQLS
jgi:hypothetical protein